MNRRDFSKTVLAAGAAAAPAYQGAAEYYEEPPRRLPVRTVDVVVAGGGTAGVVAAVAAARQGARAMLIESKGYAGGTVVEGGTALHSYYNLWKPFSRRLQAQRSARNPEGDRGPVPEDAAVPPATRRPSGITATIPSAPPSIPKSTS